jgi:hypothetical protein
MRFWFVSHVATVVLVNLEVTDKLRIVIVPSLPVRAYNFGAVCDSFGVVCGAERRYRLRSSPSATTRRSATICEAAEADKG